MAKEIENALPKVKQQYEEFPYPERKPEDEKTRLVLTMSSQLPLVNQIAFKGKCDFNNFRVLVAGGGTGDAAIAWAELLRKKENSEVVYLDMSTKSMSIAQERAKVRKLENITWLNESLLDLPNLNLGEFDFIDCSGVLHHLKDPDEGLKALKSVLKPKGVMFIMVYAKYGRSTIYIMQELMRMVNANEPDSKKQIINAKKILESQPSYNLFNILQGLKVWHYNDTKNDAGIYDLLLHSQDRPYTILEVHDWLERCNLNMISEPGSKYESKQYIPDTYIKDKELLELIHSYPLKIQQAIAEAMSTHIARQCFFCTHEGNIDTEAKLTDEDMVLYKGNSLIVDFKELATIALQRNETFTITYDKHPMKPEVEITHGKYIVSLLNQIDGERTVKEVIDAVKNSPKYADKGVDDNLLMEELEILTTSLRRAGVLFLKHKSIPPFENVGNLQEHLRDMYKK